MTDVSRLDRVGLRHLRYFLAVLDHQKIAAAAEALYVAPSGISQTIRELEDRLGARLFDRGAGGSRPTPAALALEGRARRALEAFDESLSVVDTAGEGPRHLSMICSQSLIREPTARLVEHLLLERPSARITVTESLGSRIADGFQAVLDGTFDVSITERPEHVPAGARIVDLPDLEPFVACPPGTPLPPSGRFTVADLVDIGLIVIPTFETSHLYRALRASDPDIDRAIAMRSEHRDAFMDLARAGAGAVLLDQWQARRAEALGCVIGRVEPLPLHRTCALVRADHSTPILEHFLDLCAEHPGRRPIGEASIRP